MIQRYEEIPAICENKNCDDYNSWETYDVEEIIESESGGYIKCPTCGEPIFVD